MEDSLLAGGTLLGHEAKEAVAEPLSGFLPRAAVLAPFFIIEPQTVPQVGLGQRRDELGVAHGLADVVRELLPGRLQDFMADLVDAGLNNVREARQPSSVAAWGAALVGGSNLALQLSYRQLMSGGEPLLFRLGHGDPAEKVGLGPAELSVTERLIDLAKVGQLGAGLEEAGGGRASQLELVHGELTGRCTAEVLVVAACVHLVQIEGKSPLSDLGGAAGCEEARCLFA